MKAPPDFCISWFEPRKKTPGVLGGGNEDLLDWSAWVWFPSPTLGRETETTACWALPNRFLLKDYLLTVGGQLPTMSEEEPAAVGIMRVGAAFTIGVLLTCQALCLLSCSQQGCSTLGPGEARPRQVDWM